MTFEREGCFGSCPIYRLELDEDGTVRWLGLGYVERIGRATKQLDPLEVRALFEAVVAFDLDTLPSHFAHPGRDRCGSEHVRVNVAVAFADGSTFEVNDFLNCTGDSTVEQWRGIEDKIDEVVGVEEWINRPYVQCARWSSDWIEWNEPKSPSGRRSERAKLIADLSDALAEDPSSWLRIRTFADLIDAPDDAMRRAESFRSAFVRAGGDQSRVVITDHATDLLEALPEGESMWFEVVSQECIDNTAAD